jgi:hypothetical protein
LEHGFYMPPDPILRLVTAQAAQVAKIDAANLAQVQQSMMGQGQQQGQMQEGQA